MGGDEDSLTGKDKACVQAKQNGEFIPHFPWAGRPSAMSRKTRLPHCPGYREKGVVLLMLFIPPVSFLGGLVSAGNAGSRKGKVSFLPMSLQWTGLLSQTQGAWALLLPPSFVPSAHFSSRALLWSYRVKADSF